MDIFSDRAIQWRESWLYANSAVKIAVFFLIWAIAWSPIGIAIAIVSKRSATQPNEIQQKLLMVCSLYILAPPTIWIAAKIEGASFLDYGLVWQPSLLLSILEGLGLGIVGLLASFFIQSFFGWIEWHWQHLQKLWSILFPILILGLGIGFVEELVFRGFLLNELQLNYTYWLAAIISSLIFAFGHLIWERKETIPQLPGLWLLGIVLVLARLVDGGSLGLAWGLHAGWIWGLSCLDSAQLISYSEKYSPLLTGINKQPLAGVAGIVCLLGTGAILYFFV